MAQPRQRAKHAKRPGAVRAAVAVAIAVGLAALAGYALLSSGEADRSARPERPGHADIDEPSRQRLMEILRKDEEQTR